MNVFEERIYNFYLSFLKYLYIFFRLENGVLCFQLVNYFSDGCGLCLLAAILKQVLVLKILWVNLQCQLRVEINPLLKLSLNYHHRYDLNQIRIKIIFYFINFFMHILNYRLGLFSTSFVVYLGWLVSKIIGKE